jgi:hypothetical protein
MTHPAEDPATDPVSRLRAALQGRDVLTVTTLLASVPVGILVDGEQPLVRHDDGGRVLPVLLSSDSVDAFGSEAEARLLRARELHAVITALEVDAVLFDPALPSAIAVPAPAVLSMLLGEPAPPPQT